MSWEWTQVNFPVTYSLQVFTQPPPPPPPPVLPSAASARQLPSAVVIPVSVDSSYQGVYQDRPQAPSINPEYQGTAPLSFAVCSIFNWTDIT